MKRKNIYFSITIFTLSVIFICWYVYLVWTGPINCNSFLDERLRTINFNQIRPGVEVDWIDKNFQFGSGLVTELHAFNSEEVEWVWASTNHKFRLNSFEGTIRIRQLWEYSIPLVTDNFPKVAYFINRPPTITVNDMLRCLKEPDAYLNIADQGPDAYLHTIAFLYLDEGYVVTGQWFYDTNTLTITNSVPLFYIDIVQPGSIEEMMKDVYITTPEAYQNRIVAEVEIWPSDISKLKSTPTIISK